MRLMFVLLKHILPFFYLLIGTLPIYTQSLGVGDFMFIAYNADGGDDFAIVLLKDVTNRTIYFTDHEADSTNPLDKSSNEGTLTWESGMTTLPAGTVIIFTDASSAGGVSHGTVSEDDKGFNLSVAGDAILAFEGSDNCTPTQYIAAIQSSNSNQFGDISGTGLDACTAINVSIGANDDGAKYTGVRNTTTTFSAYIDSIKNINNWITSAGDGESLLPFDGTAFTIIMTCTDPIIIGRDTTICMGTSLDLKKLLSGSLQGGLRYGIQFGIYPDTITALVMPNTTTTYYIQDSVAGTTCNDTAKITVMVMDCSIPCGISVTFSDTNCNANGTYTLKVKVDSTHSLSNRMVAILDGSPKDTLAYPSMDRGEICIESSLKGDGTKGVQLILADTAKMMTMLFVEDFETDGNGTRYTTSIPEFKEVDSDFFGRTDGSDIGTYNLNGQSGNFFFGIEDVNANGASDIDTLKIIGIDIKLATELIFKGLFAEEDAQDGNQDWDNNTELIIQTQIDDGGYGTILQFSAEGGTNSEPRQDTNFDGIGDGTALAPIFTEFIANISGSGSVLDILIILENFDAGDEDVSFDNLMVKGRTYTCADTITYDEPTCLLATIATIGDPCDCCNPDNIDISGDGIPDIFKEEVIIGSNTGETWTVMSSTGLLNITGNAISTLSFVEAPSGTYTSTFYHGGGTGYTVTLTNGTSTLIAMNTCAVCTSLPPVPDPKVSDVALCFDGQKPTAIVPDNANALVLTEDFETEGLNTRFFLDRDTFTTLADTSVSTSSQGKHFFIRTDGSNIRSTSLMYSNVQGDFWWGASDLNKNTTTLSASATMTFASKPIQGLCGLYFSVFLAEDDVWAGTTSHWNKEDFIHFDYAIDGGSFQNLLHIESDGGAAGSAPFVDTDFDGDGDGMEVTGAFQKFSSLIDAVGDSIILRISMFLDATEEDIAFDSIKIMGSPATYNFYDNDPKKGGVLLAVNAISYDPLVTRANSPQTIWVESTCRGCKGLSLPVIVGVHPDSDGSIACLDEVYVSVDETCNIHDVDITAFYAGAIEPIYFQLNLKTEDHKLVELDSLHTFVDQQLKFEIIDTCSQNRCWGIVNIEDNSPPKSKNCACDASVPANVSPLTAPDSCKYSCLDSIYYYEPLFFDNCQFGMTADTLGIYVKTDSIDIGCDTIQIIRTWFWKDTIHEKQKVHEICKQVYYHLPVHTDDILWPPVKMILACDSVDLQVPVDQVVKNYGKHFAGPYYINNVLDTILLTNDSINCHLAISYKDDFVQTCINESRILRTWRVLDWCTHEYYDSSRLIDVKDKKAPDFGVITIETEILNSGQIVLNGDTSMMSAIEIDIDIEKFFQLLEIRTPFDCSIDFEIPIFNKLKDNCSPLETIKLEYEIDAEEAYFDSENPRMIRNIPSGFYKIRIAATDECGNINEHTLSLVVLDKAEPIPLCKDTIMTVLVDADELLDGGISQVAVQSFDLATHDVCGEIILILAQRKDRKFFCGGNFLKFIGTDYLEFCCEDIGQYIPVELTFFDNSGNKSKCISQILIENKNIPILECEDVIINCNDAIHPDWLGYPFVSTTCRASDLIYTDDYQVDDLCFRGYIKREWTIINSDVRCTQVITINESDNGNDQTIFDPASIRWPLHNNGKSLRSLGIENKDIVVKEYNSVSECITYDYEGYNAYRKLILPNYNIDKDIKENCKMNPSAQCILGSLSEPTWADPNCGLVGKTFEDAEFTFNDNVCKTILRSWVVIDWCIFNVKKGNVYNEKIIYIKDKCNDTSWFLPKIENGKTDGYYTFTQEITVKDQTPPVLNVKKIVKVNVGSGSKKDQAEGSSVVYLNATANDYCGQEEVRENPRLIWKLQLVKVFYDEGTEEIVKDKTGREWRPINSIETGKVEFRFEGQAGDSYHVKWRVTDGCNNRSEAITKVIFIDLMAPTIQCQSAISSAIIKADGEVTIWALDFAEAYDNKDQQVDVWFKDENDKYVPSISISCFDVNGIKDTLLLNIYAVDGALNESYCPIRIEILNPDIPCSQRGFDGATIAGNIFTESGKMTEAVEVSIRDTTVTTTADGIYSFYNNMMGLNYHIKPSKNDDVLNGVSALDLLLIQKHILGLKKLDSPYKIIASDINNDGHISTLDLVELRSVILGLKPSFSNNTSWRFSDALEEITDIENPFSEFKEEVTIEILAKNEINDFIAVKIGDVSGDVVANNGMTVSRSEYEMSFCTQEQSIKNREYVEVNFSAKADKINAFQFTLAHKNLEFVKVEKGEIDITAINIGVFPEKLSIAWSDVNAVSSNKNLFALKFKALSNVILSNSLSINSIPTNAIVYHGENKKSRPLLKFEKNKKNIEVNNFQLYQNSPNPFQNRTNIEFTLEQSGLCTITIFDITGKPIVIKRGEFKQGYNQVAITVSELRNSGIYYYQLENEYNIATRKMIAVDR